MINEEKFRTKIAELETVLEAWHNIFGTTQLTHAQARLEVAEQKVERIVKKMNELERRTRLDGDMADRAVNDFIHQLVSERVMDLL
jgi:exonuclease VII small subunit